MSVNGINYVSTITKGKFSDKVDIVAKNSAGQVLGTINSETALNKMYGSPIQTSYYDFSKYTAGQKFTKPHMYISSLQVDANSRNSGIGRQLVARVVQESANRGYGGRVVVGAGNCFEKSPLPFYKKLGFITTNKLLNENLDYAAKYRSFFDNSIHSFMVLPRKAVNGLLKIIR